MIEDMGNMEINSCNDANIPVSCFITNEDTEYPNKWVWTAENYMPRKSMVTESAYCIVADTKEEILDAVRKFVVPLYKIALEKLETTGKLYYWEKD